jgi:hypothetical protein
MRTIHIFNCDCELIEDSSVGEFRRRLTGAISGREEKAQSPNVWLYIASPKPIPQILWQAYTSAVGKGIQRLCLKQRETREVSGQLAPLAQFLHNLWVSLQDGSTSW